MIIDTFSHNPVALGHAIGRIRERTAGHRRPSLLQRLFGRPAKPVRNGRETVISPGEIIYSANRRTEIRFRESLRGHHVYDFCCAGCGRKEDLCVPKDSRRGIRCPAGCGTVYEQQAATDTAAPKLLQYYTPDVIAVD